MIYKKFEFSQSLYPNGKILFIARGPSGGVAFRESSVDKLKKAIDIFEKDRKEAHVKSTKNKSKSGKTNKRGLFQKPVETANEENPEVKNKETAKSILDPQENAEENVINEKEESLIKKAEEAKQVKSSTKKASFWDRLK
jgi:hypothetical protein